MKHISALILALALTGCETPALNNAIPIVELQKAKRVLVVSEIGSRIDFERQGMLKGDQWQLELAIPGIDERAANAFARRLRIDYTINTIPLARSAAPELSSIYPQFPPSSEPDLSRAALQLHRLLKENDAEYAVIVFRGWGDLPGAAGNYYVRNPAISNMTGRCLFFPFLMLGVVSASSSGALSVIRLPAPPESVVSELPQSACTPRVASISPRDRDRLVAAYESLLSDQTIAAYSRALTQRRK
jgi:hypothetical protein